MEKEISIEKRLERIKKWFKNPYNLGFFAIIVLAIIIRLYYFNLTSGQPLWWDEGEFISMAKNMAFGIEHTFDPVRPILFSFITSIFLRISAGEVLPRFLILIFSIFSVIGVYYLGKEVYNKKVGLIASFLMSIFSLNLFFSYRIMMEIPSLAFFTFSMFLFYKYFKSKSNKALYWAVFLLAIGTMFKQNTAFILLGILIYLLITEKFNFIKRKEIWIAGIIFILTLSPYIIWGYMQFGGFIFTQAASVTAPDSYILNSLGVFKNYLKMLPGNLSWIFLTAFILGLISMYKLILGLDVLLKNKNKSLNKDFYIFILFFIPLILVSIFIAHNENRYILNSFPAIFIISSMFIIKTYNFIKKKNKFIAIIFIIGLVIFAGYSQLKDTNLIIKNKINSYQEIKDAGLWLKENTLESEIIATQSLFQIKAYSERGTTPFGGDREKFEEKLESNPNIKYYLVSIIQKSPDWTYSYPEEKGLEVIQAYFADYEQTQPTLVIYKI